MPAGTMNRRNFLQRSGALALGATAGLVSPASVIAAPPNPARKRVLRAAHLTDIHVRPDQPDLQHPAAGMAEAIRRAQADAPDLLLFGGDCIGDALYTPRDEVLAQWDLWNRVFSAEVKTPAKLCLGNHDIYGWAHKDRAAAERDALYGKAYALERLGLKDRYYSFDQGGWHFVVLDSMQPDYASNHHYIARLDETQFAWLARDLAATAATTPICVLSHIPIFGAAAFLDGPRESERDWMVPGAWMHIDARRIKDLFRKHPNVKVCLSGHLHLEDDVTYLGVRYLCNGSVCGGWWKGKYQEFGPTYARLDFYDDGTVENTLVRYRGE